MKPKKSTKGAAVKAGIAKMINEATGFKPPRRTTKGPEPERLKITGYDDWEDAATAIVRAKKPASGWPK